MHPGLLGIALLLLSLPLKAQTDLATLLGKIDPAKDNRFARIPYTYTSGAAKGAYLRTEALESFSKMWEAARKDGVTLTIVSATRTFDAQRKIWEDKWTGRRLVDGENLSELTDTVARARIILRYSSMPGTSRHHWGTDLDLNSLDNAYFDGPEGSRVYNWLLKHAAEYGFCQPYTSKSGGRTGYEEERWHWSYMPLAGPLLAAYQSRVTPQDILGFMGSGTAEAVSALTDFVAGVACTN
jgi:LAS superfamily LD-carboxypeptidase LdcB